ncbi:orotidine-5'-phosphate decarboxylase [Paenibacillus sp. IB182496]|uniref:Orotidine 5'-phosphate decarboxylase n=1 Tax=Paenibacillus sabuli TaxID=2772509 RepID=A0A927BVS6_9BACL|nr:orotidine-5'-phosphate decarboxylase [Paenibacillus sabuli]MBD2846263.1 orotidine-5'-phosphate decarboxylase [Paenibacillus sabuli]
MQLTKAEAAGKIMVALDYPTTDAAAALVQALRGIPCWLKVGMQLYYAAGPSFVAQLKEQGYAVFLDLKLHDIPNTVKGASEVITRLGVDLFNVHAAGGVRMMEAALEGVDRARAGSAGGAPPQVIGVTQLTSTSRETLNEEIGIAGTVEDCVVRYAQLAHRAGLSGVVASPLEVQAVKTACGRAFRTVTPGIRPAGAEAGDQSRIMTPQQALACGTDYMVIGRPITGAPDPREALQSIIEELV